MGLFDLLGGLEAEATQHAALYDEVAKWVSEEGGVSGLEQKFQQNGMGGMISGWISNGTNPPITGEQIVQVLGQDKITEIASKAGLSEEQVAAGISKLLPLVINHLAPNGTTPEHDPCAVTDALGALKSKLLGS